MKAGCTGCLGALVAISLGAVLLGGLVGVTIRILALPDVARPEIAAEDGARARQKLLGLSRRRQNAAPVILSEAEVNALLARHVMGAGGTKLEDLAAQLLGDDRMQIRARTPLGSVLEEVGLGSLARTLPVGWRARPLALNLGARVSVESVGPRQLRLELDELSVGRQRLPTLALRLLVDPAALGLLRWRLPDHVEGVEIEPGRVVIRTTS